MSTPVTFLHVSTNSRMLTPLPVPTLYNDGGLSNLFFSATAMCASTKSTTCTKSRIVVPSRVGCFVPITVSLSMFFIAASKHAPEILPCSRNSARGNSPNTPSGSPPNTLKYRKIDALNFGFASA